MLLSQAVSTFSKRADPTVAVTERIKEGKEENMHRYKHYDHKGKNALTHTTIDATEFGIPDVQEIAWSPEIWNQLGLLSPSKKKKENFEYWGKLKSQFGALISKKTVYKGHIYNESTLKTKSDGSGEKALWLRGATALVKDLSLILSTMSTVTPAPGTLAPSSVSTGACTHMCIHTYRCTYIHIINN